MEWVGGVERGLSHAACARPAPPGSSVSITRPVLASVDVPETCMKPILKASLPTLLLAAMLGSGAVWADPPDHAPAHGYRGKHHYIYYPQKQIYYGPEPQLWFWLD